MASEETEGLVKPAIPVKIDDYKRKKDAKLEKQETEVGKTTQTLSLVLDSTKCHVILNPVCKECKHNWHAIFVLATGDKMLACPRCKKKSIIGIKPGDPAKTQIIR